MVVGHRIRGQQVAEEHAHHPEAARIAAYLREEKEGKHKETQRQQKRQSTSKGHTHTLTGAGKAGDSTTG